MHSLNLSEILVIAWIISNGPFIKPIKSENTCGIEDYLPCACLGFEGNDMNYITCTYVGVSDVTDVFNRTHAIELSEINISIKNENELIPDNWISNKKAGRLYFDCGIVSTKTIARNAFYATREYTTVFEISNCLFQDSDLSFVEGFNKLSLLSLNQIHDIGILFSTFPRNLPSIVNLKFANCFGWNTLTRAPLPIVNNTKLVRLDIVQSTDMDDEVMNLVMDWAVQSFAVKSLYIPSNNLKRIPHQIEFFGQIATLDISNNFILQIPSRSLKFTSSVLEVIDLSNCGIKEIEAGAFEGKFDDVFINLSKNNLTRLDSTVFEVVLLAGGSIDVFSNRLDCNEDPCHLAWIFNQNLLQFILNAACSNGTSFQDLDPESFIECYIPSTIEFHTVTESTTSIVTSQANFYDYTSHSEQPTTTTKFLVTTYYSSSDCTSISTTLSTVTTNESTIHQTSDTAVSTTATPYQPQLTTNGAPDFILSWITFATILLSFLAV